MAYSCFILDADMPIDWIVQAAHEKDVSVYGMLQPYRDLGKQSNTKVEHASPEMMRAASANFWQAGVDGLYTWFMPWPLGEKERLTLTEMGDWDHVKEADKHYFLLRRREGSGGFDYGAHLPGEIPKAGEACEIPFTVADDPANPRISRMMLKLDVTNLLTPDRLEIRLNGESLASERLRRRIRPVETYTGQRLEIDLVRVRPRTGANKLEISLAERPAGFEGGIVVEEVELLVQYDVFPAGG